MLARLVTGLACNFYKTKWTHHLQPKHPDRALQVPFTHWKIFNGDSVKIRTGDDKGKIGRVVKVFRKLNRIVVRGLNKN